VEDACRGIGLPLANGDNTLAAAQSRLTSIGVLFVAMDELS
jgi:hypothetical protein